MDLQKENRDLRKEMDDLKKKVDASRSTQAGVSNRPLASPVSQSKPVPPSPKSKVQSPKTNP
ncbi:MAG: hypothetical protein NT154_26000 [Verrucomicrobia bacterium]|nr:hypothetical protein [Verrucomicrobiota bacterium]